MRYNNLYSYLQKRLTGRLENVTSVGERVLFTSLPFVSDDAIPSSIKGESLPSDDMIQADVLYDNRNFDYHIFYSNASTISKDCIILLHGLNERSWDKYLPWGFELSRLTGKTVILFPISYHINRSPLAWSNPRLMKQYVDARLRRLPNTNSLSIANVALSERLEKHPERFVLSGYQAASDLIRLTNAIRSGTHPLFEKGTRVDFFGYSIGAFLSQVLLLSNLRGLLDQSKFFLFCGGSAFQGMNGISRYIMDSVSYNTMYSFYMNDGKDLPTANRAFDYVLHETAFGMAFKKMVRFQASVSGSLFGTCRDRMQVVSLKKDEVIPTCSINKTLPSGLCEELNFDHPYSHENPFPLYSINSSKLMEKVNDSFQVLFEKAAAFFMVPC